MQGKVFEGTIAPQELNKWEKKVQVINLRNEADGSVSLRYIGKQEDMPDAVPKEPRLEDLYLQLFPSGNHSMTTGKGHMIKKKGDGGHYEKIV